MKLNLSRIAVIFTLTQSIIACGGSEDLDSPLSPTAAPTQVPTAVPTETPTAVPTETPTAVPTEVPTAVPTETPTAIPTAEPTASPIPTATPVPTPEPPTPTPEITPTPSTTPSPSAGLDSIGYYVFGHSLYTWDAQSEAGSTAESSTGYWLGALAQANSKGHGGTGQFGQLSYHSIPPVAQIGYSTNTFDPWPSGSFVEAGFSHVLVMPSNFEQTYLSPAEYMPDTSRVINYVMDNLPNTEVIIYEHWPEPPLSGSVANGANLTDSEWLNYRNYTSGGYHEWFVEWQNEIIDDYPQTNVRMIPIGPVLADLISSEAYMSSVAYTDLYEDDAPHGSRTTYFLSALLLYRTLYLEWPSTEYSPPSGMIVSEVTENLAEIIDFMEQRLNFYNSNGVNVYLD